MIALMQKAGKKIVLDVTQDRNDTNWYSTITRIPNAKPDLVIVSISAVQAANFVKQYAEAGITTPLFSDYPPPPRIFERQVGAQAGKIGLVRAALLPRERHQHAGAEGVCRQAQGARAEGAQRGARSDRHWDIASYDAVRLVADAVKRGGPQGGRLSQGAGRDQDRSRDGPLRVRRRARREARGPELRVHPHTSRTARSKSFSNAMLTQILINGLVLAGSYALVAVGLTLTFGVMRMVNFAEGQSVMIGAFVAFTGVPYLGYVGAIAAAMAVNAVLGVILERTAFRPFRGVELNGLIASMGMSIVLVNIAELVWGTTPRPFDTLYNETSITFGTVGISVQRLICVVASAAILLGLWWLVQYTSLGRKFRAVSEDHETAAAMGIDVNQVSRLALVIGSMMAASAGALAGPVNMIAPDMGRTEMLNAFAAIILGGFGNVNGTILGALLIGMIQSVGAVYISNAYSTSIAFGLLVLTLIFFPRGLVPGKGRRECLARVAADRGRCAVLAALAAAPSARSGSTW